MWRKEKKLIVFSLFFLAKSGLPPDAAKQMETYLVKIPEILALHTQIHRDLENLMKQWRENALVGSVWLRYGAGLEASYPPYVNLIEQLKKFIEECEKKYDRFQAHLNLLQADAAYGRQNFKDLLVRPVQRLASVDVLLTDILKATADANPDHAELARARLEVKRVLTFINSAKQAAEVEEMLKDIEDAPVDMMVGHGVFVGHLECTELAGGQFHSKGAPLCVLLFRSSLVVAKRRYDRRLDHGSRAKKPLKFLQLIPLMRVKEIVDVQDEGDQVGIFFYILVIV